MEENKGTVLVTAFLWSPYRVW